MKKVFKVSILFLSGYLFSCGVKGNPKLPPSTVPEPVKDIHLKQQGDSVLVYWIYNPLYEDNKKIKEKFFFKVEENDTLIHPKILSQKNIYWFRKKIKSYDREYCYRIEIITQRGEKAKSGYFCLLPEKNYPPEIKITTTKVEEGEILLIFNKKAQRVNIYKGTEKEKILPVPFAKETNKNFFLDNDVISDKTYCYYITQVSRKFKNLESKPSPVRCVIYRDIFPPKPPVNPDFIDINGKRIIIWSDSPSKDVVGYLLYKNGKPIFGKPIKTYFYIDKSPKKGDVYTIFAVDKRGNKSRPSYLKTE